MNINDMLAYEKFAEMNNFNFTAGDQMLASLSGLLESIARQARKDDDLSEKQIQHIEKRAREAMDWVHYKDFVAQK